MLRRLLELVVRPFPLVAAFQLDGLEMRKSATGVEVRVPYWVVLTDRETNLRYVRSWAWFGLVDVGHMWCEFEVFDPDYPSRRRYLGDSSSYATGCSYLELEV